LTLGLLFVVVDLGEALAHSPLLALVTLFGAGLVTSLTPCIYPMIPITAGSCLGRGSGARGSGVLGFLYLTWGCADERDA